MQDDTLTPSLDTDAPAPRESAALRRRSRQDRQARVGILRNVNDPPKPPARRPALLGRFPTLRSSRRPQTQAVEAAAQQVVRVLAPDGDAAARAPVPLRRDADGTVLSVDIAGLMASVEGIGTRRHARTPYAASMRADGPAPDAPPPAPRKAAILTAAAWIDDQDDPAEDADALAQAFRDATDGALPRGFARRPSRQALRIVLLGALLALFVLVLLPAWGALQPA